MATALKSGAKMPEKQPIPYWYETMCFTTTKYVPLLWVVGIIPNQVKSVTPFLETTAVTTTITANPETVKSISRIAKIVL